jgi:hypothetical protein
MSWTVTSDQPGRQRLLEVTHHALGSLQAAVTTVTAANWPARTPDDEFPEPHAAIAGDSVNPTLRLWYGPPDSPVLELTPPILLNMILYARG